MDLGTHTFVRLPGHMTIIDPKKINAIVDTYSDVAYFSWTPSIVGLRVELIWAHMSKTEYDAIQVLFENDIEIIFDPTDYVAGSTYNVEMVKFGGKYMPAFPTRRLNCKLDLLIMSEV